MAAAEILGVLDLRQRVASSASAVAEVVAARLEEWRQARSPAQFRAMTLEVAGVAREFADEVVEHLLRDMLSDREFVVPARLAARAGLGKLRNRGGREVTVTLLGGRKVRVVADYLRPDSRGRPGPRRGSGRRGKGGAGVYPALAASVVVAADGGRVRERVPLPGRRKASGRHGFDTPWLEPKLFTTYVIDAGGSRRHCAPDS